MWWWILGILIGIFILTTTHFGRMIFVVLIGLIYWPLNWMVVNFGANVNPLKKDEKVLFYVLWALFSPVWMLTTIISIPYEAVLEKAH